MMSPLISGIQLVLQNLYTTSVILEIMFPDADRIRRGLTAGTRRCRKKPTPSPSSSLDPLHESSGSMTLSSICDVVRSIPSRLMKSVSRSRFSLGLGVSDKVLFPSVLDLESKPPLVAIPWRPKLIFFSGTSWRCVSSRFTIA
jgi:hypothetical protein